MLFLSRRSGETVFVDDKVTLITKPVQKSEGMPAQTRSPGLAAEDEKEQQESTGDPLSLKDE